jgi:alanyl-tRNA synthetase
MSLVEEKHEWGAVRVRQTFIDYFKERGHEFGTLGLVTPVCMS